MIEKLKDEQLYAIDSIHIAEEVRADIDTLKDKLNEIIERISKHDIDDKGIYT